MKSNNVDQLGPSEWKWLLLAVVAFSYPLAALFGDSDGSLSAAGIPTILALAIAGLIGARNSEPSYIATIVIVSVGLLIFSGIQWVTEVGDSHQKIITFSGVLVIFGTVLATSFGTTSILNQTDRAFMILGLIALGLFVSNISEYDTGRLTYGDSNPIWMGRLFGMACVASVYMLVSSRMRPLIVVPLLLAFFVAMVLTGSRGPVFAFFLATLVAVIINPINNKYVFISIGLYVGLILILLSESLNLDFGARGLSFGQADDVSYFIRLNMFDYTIDTIRSFPEGIGVGSFYFMGFTYPHNIYLEFIAEWGWFFGGTFIVFIFLGGYFLFLRRDRLQLLLILYVFEVVNGGLSGDITSPRLLYGLAIAGFAFQFSSWRNKKFSNSAGEVSPMLPAL